MRKTSPNLEPSQAGGKPLGIKSVTTLADPAEASKIRPPNFFEPLIIRAFERCCCLDKGTVCIPGSIVFSCRGVLFLLDLP